MHPMNRPHLPHRDTNSPTAPEQDSLYIFEESFDPTKAEKSLWSAVITQALMDAGSESRKPEAQHEKAKAIRWLLGNSEDFVTVCQNAGLDPHYVREKAKSAIERGCVWRRGMAEKRGTTETETSAFPMERKYYIPTSPAHQPRPLHFSRRTSQPSRIFPYAVAPYTATSQTTSSQFSH